MSVDACGYLDQCARRVDQFLDGSLPAESVRPAELHRAMRYSLFAGGKRLRPALCLAAADAIGRPDDGRALRAAAALECLHTYTLIHDDLPAMDNDELRRGRPTSHVMFGEANAILAGDCLLTAAFEILAECPAPPPRAPCAIALELARAAGSRGVAGGQYEDLAAETRPADEATLRFIHTHKTAILIRASCRMGGMAAGAEDDELEALGRYGDDIGLAFQIADDVLDATSTPEQLGKNTGRDAENQKMTWVNMYGIEASRRQIRALTDSAVAALARFGPRGDTLRALAVLMSERKA
ncbi:MAG: polyprenyl synthetase family protein [Kiritimatiellae bacterium]|nr:polyprenyl synthetase family protein [Kiritimatiellia bacterium]